MSAVCGGPAWCPGSRGRQGSPCCHSALEVDIPRTLSLPLETFWSGLVCLYVVSGWAWFQVGEKTLSLSSESDRLFRREFVEPHAGGLHG